MKVLKNKYSVCFNFPCFRDQMQLDRRVFEKRNISIYFKKKYLFVISFFVLPSLGPGGQVQVQDQYSNCPQLRITSCISVAMEMMLKVYYRFILK